MIAHIGIGVGGGIVLLLQVITQQQGGAFDWLWPLVNSAGLIAVAGAVTQYIVPRMRKMREKAEKAQIEAETAKTAAETAKTNADTANSRFDWYQEQLEYLQKRVDEQEKKHDILLVRFAENGAHTEDLYQSLGYETPEIQERIKGRLRTKRPNGYYSGNNDSGEKQGQSKGGRGE